MEKTNFNLYKIMIFLLINGFFTFYNYLIMLNFIEAISVFVLLLTLINLNNNNKLKTDVLLNKYTLWASLNLLLFLISVLWAKEEMIALSASISFLQILVMSTILMAYMVITKDVLYIIKCFFVAGIICCFYVILNTPESLLLSTRFGSAIEINENQLGANLCISFLCGLFLLNNKKKQLNITTISIIATMIIIMIAIMLSGSRKDFLSLLVCVFVFNALMSNNKWKIIKFATLSIIMGALLYYLAFNIPELYNILGVRIESMETYFSGGEISEGSIIIRNMMINDGINLFFEKPFLGYGISCFMVASSWNTYSHNNYVEMLVGVGALGTILYYTIYVWAFRNGIRIHKQNSLFGTFIITFITMLMLFDIGVVSYYNEIIQLALVTCCSMIINSPKHGIKELS